MYDEKGKNLENGNKWRKHLNLEENMNKSKRLMNKQEKNKKKLNKNKKKKQVTLVNIEKIRSNSNKTLKNIE